MNSDPLLTIAIPTFNRNAKLAVLIKRLLPQISGPVRLVIQDNCSDVPVAKDLAPLLAAYPASEVRLIRNKINVGANANILRWFDLCETEWIWVVGDDDDIAETAVATILRNIQANRDCLLLNFPIDDLRSASFRTVGPEEFADRLDKSADVPWIASTVYKSTELTPNLRFGYQYAFSMLPHIALLMMSMHSDHSCFFSTDRISSRERAGADTAEQTPIVNMALGFPVLLDLPLDLGFRRKLVNKLLVTNDSPGIPLRQLAYQLLLQSVITGERWNSMYVFHQACRRRFYFDQSLSQRLETLAYGAMLRLPPKAVASAYKMLKGRPITDQVRQDRSTRL